MADVPRILKVRDVKRLSRTRARVKDLDQIHDDLKRPEKLQFKELDPDLPGLGQFYCMECARHFENENALTTHLGTKLHKKRLKVLKEEPYTQAEAEAAVGMSTDNGVRKNQAGAKEMDVEA
ncbi:Bud site selection protein 20 [Phlyctochytrium planicorne]|nr:Bud site selection protein 20 [Phlyctochytrium planicorne]